MEIGDVSSNTFVHQVSGVMSGKQILPVNPVSDVNVSAQLQNAQNIGKNAVRRTEENTPGSPDTGVSEDEKGKGRKHLDLLV